MGSVRVTEHGYDDGILEEHLEYMFPFAPQRAAVTHWMAAVSQGVNDAAAHPLLIGGESVGKSLLLRPLLAAARAQGAIEVCGSDLRFLSKARLTQNRLIVLDHLYGAVGARRLRRLHRPGQRAAVGITDDVCLARSASKDTGVIVAWSDVKPASQGYYARLAGWLQTDGQAAGVSWLLRQDLNLLAELSGVPTEPLAQIPWDASEVTAREVAARLRKAVEARQPPFETDLIALPEVMAFIGRGLGRQTQDRALHWLGEFLRNELGAVFLGHVALGLAPREVPQPRYCAAFTPVPLYAVRNSSTYVERRSFEPITEEFWRQRIGLEEAIRQRRPRPWLRVVEVRSSACPS